MRIKLFERKLKWGFANRQILANQGEYDSCVGTKETFAIKQGASRQIKLRKSSREVKEFKNNRVEINRLKQ